ncbi:hypothetical protein SAMN05216581_5226 [Pseudomonas asplenii]|uniref:Uncharacterized protein n=1 Tax=Pseudomonas asplenii TaxID=53407 RepID=A0A1H6P7B6_9PSED|nr:hypothetical protein SAMN05216581_5226 [Pseudomonas fuscovaginae]
MHHLHDQMLDGIPLMRRALAALSLYQEARNSSAPFQQVELLRVEAAWLFDAASDYQLSILSDYFALDALPRC